MALVPKHTYEAWFSRGSWIYHNFAFLFDNPLWQRAVPQGFSLCPYFWASLFSLFVFRPLVYVVLGLRGAAKALRLNGLIQWTDGVVLRVTPDCNRSFGLPTILGVGMLSSIGTLIGLLCYVVGEYYATGVLSLLIIPAVLLVALLCCGNYASNHENDANRCPVEIYLRTVTVLSVIAAAVLHPSPFLEVFVGFPWDFACWVVGSLWGLISGIFGALWASVLWGFSWGWWLLGFLAVGSVYGWLASRWLDQKLAQPIVSAKERRDRLNALADTFNVTHTEGTFTTWRWLLVNRCADLLERYLFAEAWDTDEVYRNVCDEVVARFDAQAEAKRAAVERRAAKCKAMSAALLKLLSPVLWVLRQARILVSYLWALIKARKSRVCPYMRFHD